MSGSGRRDRAFPVNELDRDWTFFNDFGGKGGGSTECAQPIGSDRGVIGLENGIFRVYNRLLIFEIHIPEFALPYTDGGPIQRDFLEDCDHSKDQRVPIHVAVSSDPNLSEDKILEQDRQIPTSWTPSDPALVFTYRDFTEQGAKGFIPQPTDPAYDGNTYFTLYWGDPNYVTINGVNPIDYGPPSINKEDFDENI